MAKPALELNDDYFVTVELSTHVNYNGPKSGSPRGDPMLARYAADNGLDLTSYYAVLAGTMAGSSALSALYECSLLVIGLQKMASANGYQNAVDWPGILGEQGGFEGVREGIRDLKAGAHRAMRASFYLWGKSAVDLAKDRKFKDAISVFGPVIKTLPRDASLAQAISVTGKLKSVAAAEALGMLY